MTAVEFIFEELENRENGSPHFTMQQIYNKAKEMEKQIADDYAIEFAKWVSDVGRIGITKELLEIFKKEKGL